jgi:hypothetical protein
VFVDGVAAVRRLRRLLDPGVELGEIRQVERRSVLLQERDHFLGDLASVKAIARRDDTGGPPLPFAARSASAMRISVRARVGSLMVSPAS